MRLEGSPWAPAFAGVTMPETRHVANPVIPAHAGTQ